MLDKDMTRPIIGIENRTAQEVFDIMCARIRSALSAQVQDESEIVGCLLAGKPFVFDPATSFCHADDGGAPEHGIKYVPAAQVQDVARDLPSEFEKWWDDAGHYVGGVVKMTYTQRKQLAWDAFYASDNAAAPAKQEGGE